MGTIIPEHERAAYLAAAAERKRLREIPFAEWTRKLGLLWRCRP